MYRQVYYVFTGLIMIGVRYGAPVNKILPVDPEETSLREFFQLVHCLVDDIKLTVKTMQMCQVIVNIKKSHLIQTDRKYLAPVVNHHRPPLFPAALLPSHIPHNL